jgi:hypothetical protein
VQLECYGKRPPPRLVLPAKWAKRLKIFWVSVLGAMIGTGPMGGQRTHEMVGSGEAHGPPAVLAGPVPLSQPCSRAWIGNLSGFRRGTSEAAQARMDESAITLSIDRWWAGAGLGRGETQHWPPNAFSPSLRSGD